MSEQSARDPDIANRIAAMTRRGASKVNPDVDKAMRGEKGKRPKICAKCGKPLGPNHQPHKKILGRSTAERMDRGEVIR